MAYLDWNGCLSDDAIVCSDARIRLDDRASPVGSLAVPAAFVGWSVARPGRTRGPCLMGGAMVMVSSLAVRFTGSRACGIGVRDDNRLSLCHDHRVACLCCP